MTIFLMPKTYGQGNLAFSAMTPTCITVQMDTKSKW